MSVIFALWTRNLKAFLRNKTALIFNLVMPFFFIYVFGAIFKNDYIDNPITFMLAGIVIAMVFDSALRISSSTIDDITSGFMKEVLVSPISRLNIAIGQFVSSATVAMMQGFTILVLGFFIGLRITNPITVLYIILAMVFVGFIFAGFGLFIATKAKNIQTFQAISMAITMPLTFISGAYIPLSMLPETLRYIAYFNPMTYAVNLFRTIVLEKLNLPVNELVSEELAFKIGDVSFGTMHSILILLVFGAIFLVLSTVAFVRVDFSKMSRNKNDALEVE
jgi:ABC-2 type transport system permease protein